MARPRTSLAFVLVLGLLASCGKEDAPAECKAHESDAASSAPAVNFVIRNNTGETVEVVTAPYDGGTPFYLSDASGELTWDPDSNCNLYTCDQVMSGVCDVGCPGCSVTETIQIAPGSSITRGWPGLIFVESDMPASCISGAQYCDSWAEYYAPCVRGVVAPAGTYTVSAGAQIRCTGGSGDDGCGGGGTGGATDCGPGGPQLTAETDFEYPDQTSVELVFE